MDNKNNKEKETRANNRIYYTGIFSNNKGKPEFYGLGNILRFIFIIYALYILTTNKYKYSVVAIICLIIGNIMSSFRYYSLTNLNLKDDFTHFMRTVVSHSFVSLLGIISLLIIYLKK